MGWASAGVIFDRVAHALVDNNVPDEQVTSVCAALIDELTAGDWDTLGESIDLFRDRPAVIEAFRRAAPDWLNEDENEDGSAAADAKPAPVGPEDVEREAWKLLLDGAESLWEDAIDEDGEFTEADYEKILARCGELIKQLRAEHGAERG